MEPGVHFVGQQAGDLLPLLGGLRVVAGGFQQAAKIGAEHPILRSESHRGLIFRDRPRRGRIQPGERFPPLFVAGLCVELGGKGRLPEAQPHLFGNAPPVEIRQGKLAGDVGFRRQGGAGGRGEPASFFSISAANSPATR